MPRRRWRRRVCSHFFAWGLGAVNPRRRVSAQRVCSCRRRFTLTGTATNLHSSYGAPDGRAARHAAKPPFRGAANLAILHHGAAYIRAKNVHALPRMFTAIVFVMLLSPLRETIYIARRSEAECLPNCCRSSARIAQIIFSALSRPVFGRQSVAFSEGFPI